MGTRTQSNVVSKAPVVHIVPALFSFAAERRYLVLIKPCVSKNGLTRLLDRFQLALIRESRWCRPEARVALDRQLVPGDVAGASTNGLGEIGCPRLCVLSG